MTRTDIVRRALGKVRLGQARPLWLETVSKLYPPLTFSPPDYVKQCKPGRVPKPPIIRYEEDQYRQRYFKMHPAEALRPVCLDERLVALTHSGLLPSDQAIDLQMKYMEDGIEAEDAYKLALQRQHEMRQQAEMEHCVAQEQLLSTSTVTPSLVIENLIQEEKEALERSMQ